MKRYDSQVPLRRRMMMPVIVAVVGAAFVWWGVARQNAASAEIQTWLLELCQRAGMGELDARNVPTADASMNGPVLSLLERASIGMTDVRQHLSVKVTPGDDAGYGNGSATHVAYIEADGVELAAFRINHPGDRQRIHIMGYWVP